MSDYRNVLERDLARVGPAPFDFDDVARRRDRKRRNQRIAAGVVGIAMFVAAIPIVTGVAFLGRGEMPVVPGGDVTGPAETGPAVTGTIGTGPGWLPPRGAEPSTPTAGELVAEQGGIHPWRYIQVYADGRVIWATQTLGWLERRLTPAGVELVRSGAIRLEDLDPPSHVPANVWEDPGPNIYVPWRYVVCGDWSQQTMRLLPQRTQDLLRGRTDEPAVVHGEVDYLQGGRGFACPAVTIEEARALDKIFLKLGFAKSEAAWGLVYDIPVDNSSIGVIPLLPDGTFQQCCPG